MVKGGRITWWKWESGVWGVWCGPGEEALGSSIKGNQLPIGWREFKVTQHQERVQRPEYPEHPELFCYWHYIRKYVPDQPREWCRARSSIFTHRDKIESSRVDDGWIQRRIFMKRFNARGERCKDPDDREEEVVGKDPTVRPGGPPQWKKMRATSPTAVQLQVQAQRSKKCTVRRHESTLCLHPSMGEIHL
jgi:hypothetical protein